ncbi:right-handed parallel beta-helix repeat-containing protein [Colwellia sp. 20A7]|uniref:right-handed parallel beta-helix repeat-containing protein n=1 Tax=Colwellia sp. 20A7 TaxID=2689569 RepID=UPI001359DC6C|nr:right-handed parallel beta-helix repeat-containing protein [Colwellia sp. 20A7]
MNSLILKKILIKPCRLIVLCCLFLTLLTACGGSNSSESTTPNIADTGTDTTIITVDAGDDLTVNEGDTVTLTAQTDAESTQSLTYLWTQTSGSSISTTLGTQNTQQFTAPLVDTAGDSLVFQVTVTDSDGVQYSDTVTITVNDIPVETFTITTLADSNGAITASSSVEYGADITITITPSIGYQVLAVTVDGLSVGALTSYQFTNVTATHTIDVTFKLADIISTSEYTMPVGIPETNLDFTQEAPERPSDWSAEVPGYYYINYQTGDKNAAYGTPSSPRQQIPNPLPAGSYVEISGEYTQGFSGKGNRMYYLNGTDAVWEANVAGPVWITSAKDTGGSIKYVGFQMSGANVYLTDLIFTDGAKVQVGSPSAGYPIVNAVVRNLDINGGGITIAGKADPAKSEDNVSEANSIVIYNNEVHHAGDMYDLDDEDYTGVQVVSGVRNLWVLDNEIHEMSGAGVQVIGSNYSTSFIYVGNNEVYRVRQSGLWVKYGNGVVFSSNYVHNIIATQWSVSKCMGSQYQPHNIWFINNVLHDCTYGIRVPSTDTVAWSKTINIVGNIIYNIAPQQRMDGTLDAWSTPYNTWQSAAIGLGADVANISNNIIYDAAAGITLMAHASTASIKNNIIYNMGYMREEQSDPYGPTLLFEAQYPNSEIKFNSNIMSENPIIRRGSSIFYTMSDLVNLGSTGNVAAAPLFTKAELLTAIVNKDYNGLNIGSLVDAGDNVDDLLVPLFTDYFTDGVGVVVDMFGMARVQGAGIDIGPFEQDGAEMPTIPDTTTVPLKTEGVQ